MVQDPNYGMYRKYNAKRVLHKPRVGISAQAESTRSALAHLSIFLNLFTGFLGPVVAFVIWLVYKDRSQRVAAHAMQSLWYQVAWLVTLGIGWTVTGILMSVLVGFLLIPVMLLLSVVPFVHATYTAYRANQGVDYLYL
ncbi:MAG: DUF4870 domain-containing protein [Rubrobacter sp.]|nr:DUF4870 domain-containing protein [Rubrobacter sp.]